MSERDALSEERWAQIGRLYAYVHALGRGESPEEAARHAQLVPGDIPIRAMREAEGVEATLERLRPAIEEITLYYPSGDGWGVRLIRLLPGGGGRVVTGSGDDVASAISAALAASDGDAT